MINHKNLLNLKSGIDQITFIFALIVYYVLNMSFEFILVLANFDNMLFIDIITIFPLIILTVLVAKRLKNAGMNIYWSLLIILPNIISRLIYSNESFSEKLMENIGYVFFPLLGVLEWIPLITILTACFLPSKKN